MPDRSQDGKFAGSRDSHSGNQKGGRFISARLIEDVTG